MSEKPPKFKSAEKPFLLNGDQVYWTQCLSRPHEHLKKAFLALMDEEPVADTPEGTEIMVGMVGLMLDGSAMYNIPVTDPDLKLYARYGLTHPEGCAAFVRICKVVGLSQAPVYDYLDALFDEVSEENKTELLGLVEVVYEGD